MTPVVDEVVVGIVIVVPMFKDLAAEIPPEVLIAPVIEEVASSVDGANNEALAPVPPMVSNVVAPAKAVNDVELVVILVVMSGEVPKTTSPDPVSLESEPKRLAEVIEPVAVP